MVRTCQPLFQPPLSEHGLPSDMPTSFSASLVRTWPPFGHANLFFSFPCPNMVSLRTCQPLFQPPLSEHGLPSDLPPSFLATLVRTWPAFGHANLFFSLPCPNIVSLRTCQPLFQPPLSEHGLPSDMPTSFSASLVRTWPPFGHANLFFSLPCPNMVSLRTCQPLFQPPLSEHGLPSDMPISFSASLVRTSPICTALLATLSFQDKKQQKER
jgi:hypothetical protein